jgi:hypothetical protein
MTSDDFRRMALGLKGVVEGAHMGHPDFRVSGRIFATLHDDHMHGMVKVTPEQQADLVRDEPGTFVPENGAWGRQGCTRVHLASVGDDTLGYALTLAWERQTRALPTTKSRTRRN